jgi:hypothetical protein
MYGEILVWYGYLISLVHEPVLRTIYITFDLLNIISVLKNEKFYDGWKKHEPFIGRDRTVQK